MYGGGCVCMCVCVINLGLSPKIFQFFYPLHKWAKPSNLQTFKMNTNVTDTTSNLLGKLCKLSILPTAPIKWNVKKLMLRNNEEKICCHLSFTFIVWMDHTSLHEQQEVVVSHCYCYCSVLTPLPKQKNAHCPNHLPPPWPQFGQLGPFFRTSKFKIWKSVRGGEGDILTT